MTQIFLQPQDVILIKLEEKQIGNINVPVVVEISYDAIMELIDQKNKPIPIRKSKNTNKKISRQIGLLCYAIKNGKWRTGATIDTNVAINKLRTLLYNLSFIDIQDITIKAYHSLIETANYVSVRTFDAAQKEHLLDQITSITKITGTKITTKVKEMSDNDE